jgi:hypothetical protein
MSNIQSTLKHRQRTLIIGADLTAERWSMN